MILQGPLLLNSLPTLKNCPKVKSARILSTVSNLLCLTRSPIVSGCSDQWSSFLIGFDGCSTSEWDTLWCPWLIISCFSFVVRLAYTPFLLALSFPQELGLHCFFWVLMFSLFIAVAPVALPPSCLPTCVVAVSNVGEVTFTVSFIVVNAIGCIQDR